MTGRARPDDRDEGSMVLELAIVMPVIIMLLLTVVALGRYSHSGIVVEQAAAAAARSASLTSTPGAAAKAARDSAAGAVADAGMSCADLDTRVDTSAFRAGGQVQVTLTCRADLSDVALTGLPGSAELTSTAAAPIEKFRPIGGRR